MTTYNYRTFVQSNGPETFDGGVAALDVVHILWSDVLAVFPSIATGDTLKIRAKSGLRQFVPSLSYLYWDANFTAGQVDVLVDSSVYISGTAMASAAARVTPGGSSQVATPVNATFSTDTSGGTLTDTTAYYYRVAARDGVGTTLASTETSITTGTSGSNINTVTVKWGLVAGATGGYDIFGRTTGAEQLIGHVAEGVSQFVDDGSVTPSGALPGANTTAPFDSAYGTSLSTTTGDSGSTVSLYLSVLPSGSTGNIYLQLATRPAQA